MNILLNIIVNIILTILYFIFINIIFLFFNKKIMNRKLLYFTMFFSIINIFIFKYLLNLPLHFIVIFHIFYCKIILKINLTYNILISFTGIFLILLLTQTLIYLISILPIFNNYLFIHNEIIYNTSKLFGMLLLNYIIYKLSKLKYLSYLMENISSKYIKLLIIFSCISILPQFINICLEKFEFNITYLLLTFIQLSFIYFFIFYFIYANIKKQKIDNENILLNEEITKLTIINEETRLFKHDFNNIMSLINGYVLLKKYNELEIYLKSLLNQCDNINSISIVNEKVFNHPAIYGIMLMKVLFAQTQKIKFNIQSSIDYYTIKFPIDNLSRILGILIDNAFEATQLNTSQKYISFDAHYSLNNEIIIEISNTFNNSKNIDINKIFNKGYSNKKIKSGLGLWEVKKIIDEVPNSSIFTKINNNLFTQKIIINNN